MNQKVLILVFYNFSTLLLVVIIIPWSSLFRNDHGENEWTFFIHTQGGSLYIISTIGQILWVVLDCHMD